MKKTMICLALIFTVLFGVLIALLATVDRAPIGPEGTVVGLASVNGAVFDRLGSDLAWYKGAHTVLIGCFAVVGAAALTGLCQWIMRKRLRAVDPILWATGGLYLITAAVYFLFEQVIINRRPILMPDDLHPEASFPSSHTLLICVILGSAAVLLRHYVKNRPLRLAGTVVCAGLAAFSVACILLSGAHWLTDVAGGLLCGGMLLAWYGASIGNPAPKEEPKETEAE